MINVLVLHGPNINLLGLREVSHYGSQTLAELNAQLLAQAHAAGIGLTTLQSQSESVLIEAIHDAGTRNTDYIIINPAAYTHTSIALRDALLGVAIPFIEVHISNVFSREHFRQHSYFSDIAQGTIQGLGVYGYVLALQAVIHKLTSRD
jgi:3-dehydroquinate dehydratase-2